MKSESALFVCELLRWWSGHDSMKIAKMIERWRIEVSEKEEAA
jgi:hypothetical protein